MAVLEVQPNLVGTFEYRLSGQQTWTTVAGVSRSYPATVLLLGPDDEIRFYPGGEDNEIGSLTFAAWCVAQFALGSGASTHSDLIGCRDPTLGGVAGTLVIPLLVAVSVEEDVLYSYVEGNNKSFVQLPLLNSESILLFRWNFALVFAETQAVRISYVMNFVMTSQDASVSLLVLTSLLIIASSCVSNVIKWLLFCRITAPQRGLTLLQLLE
jgi:hypothetical protein